MDMFDSVARAAPLLVAGAAAGWYLRRRGRQAAPSPGTSGPPPAAGAPPPEAVDGVLEREAQRVESVSDAADVTAVVEDLLSAQGPGDGTIVDADVVDDRLGGR